MSTILTLNIVKDNKEQVIRPDPDVLYGKFKTFMHNPKIIRYGLYEKIGSKRLTQLFNDTMRENISFNHTFPKLMAKFIEEYSQYGITKKTMTEGVTYLRVGHMEDPAPKQPRPPLTIKEKNDRATAKKILMLNNIRDAICRITGWTLLQYQRLTELKLINIISFGKNVNLEATIKVIMGRLIEHLHSNITELNCYIECAKIVKEDFERAIKSDLDLSSEDTPIRYEDRLKASDRTYVDGRELELAIENYVGKTNNLPILDYIVYPDIQYWHNVARWLKDNSPTKVKRDMIKTHKLFEISEEIENDQIITSRIIDAGLFVTRLTDH